MVYPTLTRMKALQDADVSHGEEPLLRLAPGSVLVTAGGNKSDLTLPEAEITALFRRLVGGVDKVVDAWGQGEGMCAAIRCEHGNYHGDQHAEYFMVGSNLAYFDPRQPFRVPAIVTGDLVDRIHEDPCPCGAPGRYFQRIRRDERRGSKGCAAALAEYSR
jgi:hypothetical protein